MSTGDRMADCDLAQPILHRILHLLISIKGGFQIPHHELLPHLVGRDDKLAQQFERQAGWLFLRILGHDLCKGDAGQILTRLRVDDLNILAFPNERAISSRFTY